MLRRSLPRQKIGKSWAPTKVQSGLGPEAPSMDPELTKYANATFTEGHARVKPKSGEQAWTDTRAWPLRLKQWIRAPVYKGTVIAAWAVVFVGWQYLRVLNDDAKSTYHHNTAVTRSLHMEALKAQEAQERLEHLQRSLLEQGLVSSDETGELMMVPGAKIQQAGLPVSSESKNADNDDEESETYGGKTTEDRRALRASGGMGVIAGQSHSGIVNWQLDLARAKEKNKAIHERNQFLVTELQKVRHEYRQMKKQNQDLQFEVVKLQQYVKRLVDPYDTTEAVQ